MKKVMKVDGEGRLIVGITKDNVALSYQLGLRMMLAENEKKPEIPLGVEYISTLASILDELQEECRELGIENDDLRESEKDRCTIDVPIVEGKTTNFAVIQKFPRKIECPHCHKNFTRDLPAGGFFILCPFCRRQISGQIYRWSHIDKSRVDNVVGINAGADLSDFEVDGEIDLRALAVLLRKAKTSGMPGRRSMTISYRLARKISEYLLELAAMENDHE